MADKGPLVKRPWEMKGIFCLAAALFLLLCLLSFYPLDPSFTHFVAGDVKTHNLIGAFGSYTADIMIRLLGFSALFIPLILFLCAYRYFREPAFTVSRAFAGGFCCFLISFSSLAALILNQIELLGQKYRAGGIIGYGVQTYLNYYFDVVGSYLLVLLVLILSLMLTMDLSLVTVGEKVFAAVSALWAKIKGRIEAGKDRHESDDETSEGPKFILEKEIPKEPIVMEEAHVPVIVKKSRSEPEPDEKQVHFPFIDSGGRFSPPPVALLEQAERKDNRVKRDTLVVNSRILEKKLADFGVEGKVVEVRPGPVITMYELEPAPGVKINRITNLSDDLALALKASSVRIIAPLPGKAAIGIEIPNQERESVSLRQVLDHDTFLESRSKLPIALGVDIVGTPVIADLIRMPHLLIAGTTGSGKSVCLNAMICSILFKASPDEVKFLMIDPKRLELSSYEGIPHLLHPVVVDPKQAALVLRWAVEEMERRYKLIAEQGVKGIDTYNKQIEKEGLKIAKLPYVVIIIDELADLMMAAQRNVEESLARIAQMARASGIHLILATQRPSVDVITGVIKANFPTRISFQVSSKVDSRTILDQLGAEALLGAGDMLFMPPGTSKLTRIHGAYVSDKEIDRIVEYVKRQGKPAYDESIGEYEEESALAEKSSEGYDEKYDEAVELVTDLGQASISLVQRYMKIGYNRAARIIERMEVEGVVGPSDGVKPRKVLARKAPHP
ncbi:MAG: DNA translocase FtsK [Syntrophus sp. SKADARSKE-3]|nr:DNA translocase FtsK [Syntrophus sp. SKADARSKE-3]